MSKPLDSLIEFLIKKYAQRVEQKFSDPHYRIEYLRGYQDASKDIIEFIEELEKKQ